MVENEQKVGKIALKLLGIYILCLSLLQVWTLPVFGSKIQPPEVVFLLIISWLALNFRHLPKPEFQISPFNISILGYVLVTVLSVVFSQYTGAYFELINLFYLLFLLFIIAYILLNFCEDIPTFIFKWFTYLGVFSAVLGISGWGIYQFGTWTPLVRSGSTYYPYFGYVGRVQGLTLTPGMFITIISISILLLSAKMLFGRVVKGDIFKLFLMLIAVFLTLSKSLVLLLIGLIYLIQKRYLTVEENGIVALTNFQKKVKFALKISSIFLLIFVLFATHFIVIQKEGGGVPAEMTQYVQAEKPLVETDNNALYLSIYGHLKQTAFEIGWENKLFGIGSGQFLNAIPAMKTEDVYPPHFEDADPHSTYFGAFAENGLIGLYFILGIWMYVFKNMIYLKSASDDKYHPLLIGFSACFLVIFWEAVFTDVLNFRHYWVLFAVFYTIYEKRGQA